jgi:glutamine synthetase
VLRAGLGDACFNAFLKLKQQDWNSYARHLTQWERDNTLDA